MGTFPNGVAKALPGWMEMPSKYSRWLGPMITTAS